PLGVERNAPERDGHAIALHRVCVPHGSSSPSSVTVTPPGDDVDMETRQLVLIDNDNSPRDEWKLDERTRQMGLDGVAEARRVLQAALAKAQDGSHSSAA